MFRSLRSACLLTSMMGLSLIGCEDAEEAIDDITGDDQPLQVEPQCVEPGDNAPADAWECGEERTVECERDVTVDLFVEADNDSCDSLDVEISDDEFDQPGEYEIEVLARTGNDDSLEHYCSAQLILEDTVPPFVESTETVELWPPNHQMRSISPDDCVEVHDACDDDVVVVFTSASSDEPENDNGDGNTSPDIEFDGCTAVNLRAERQGNGDGRVYSVHWRATDDAGNVEEGNCRIVVPHDQGQGDEAEDSGEEYSRDAPDECDED